jgi:aspartate aminotransferase
VPDATVDVRRYQEKRDLLCDALTAAGYELTRPQGSYYVFPKTPIPDDVAFIRILQEEGILAVPGTGFGRSGYMRLSITIPLDDLKRSLPGFARAMRHLSGADDRFVSSARARSAPTPVSTTR